MDGPTATQASPPGAPAPVPRGAPGVEPFDPASAVVRQTVRLADDPDASVELGVPSLRVQGEVVQLRLAVTPDLGGPPTPGR